MKERPARGNPFRPDEGFPRAGTAARRWYAGCNGYGVTTTLLSLFSFRPDLAAVRERLRRAAARTATTSERAARSAAHVAADYWYIRDARERENLTPKILDLVVLLAAGIVGSAAFALALSLAPGAEGPLFLLYALGLVALSALGFELLFRLAREAAVPTTALAARAPGRHRRIVKARLRWLRRLLKRAGSGPGAMRPSLA